MGSSFPDTLDELAESLLEGTFEPWMATGARPEDAGAMKPRTPRRLGGARSNGSPAAQRARTAAKLVAPLTDTKPKASLLLSEMPADALDKIVCRVDSPDMVSLCRTCKATRRAVSADWLWRSALARDFPTQSVQKLRFNQSVHTQLVYATTFSQIVSLTRERTRARFKPEQIQSNSFVFALPAVDSSSGVGENDSVAIPQAVSHIVLAKAIEGVTSHIDRTHAKSFNLGFVAHGLATLEGIRCVS